MTPHSLKSAGLVLFALCVYGGLCWFCWVARAEGTLLGYVGALIGAAAGFYNLRAKLRNTRIGDAFVFSFSGMILGMFAGFMLTHQFVE